MEGRPAISLNSTGANSKKVSMYIGFQYVVTFEKEKSYFKNSASG
jgi:hypothetical protein